MTPVAQLLAELVAIPTHQKGGDERRLCDHLAPLLAARGADEVVVETAPRSDGSPGAYVFARWGTPRRIINAHVDTVPANRGWTVDPWTPQIEGGRVWGRPVDVEVMPDGSLLVSDDDAGAIYRISFRGK